VSGDPAVLGWSTADFNQPVSQDMSLQTGPMASARVRIGPNAIQMSGDTLIDVLNLSDQIIEISVRVGRIHLQLSRLSQIESVEIPYGSVWLLQTGAYEIETGTADQPARVVVFDGRARFIGGKVDLPIDGGEEARVTGPHPLGVSTGPASPTATSGAPNHGETVRRYREAADRGNASAQYDMGWLYENGQGVPQDYREAMRWYRKAANQGKAAAQNSIGSLYQNGQGVEQDYGEAMRWYRRAADQAYPAAQSNIGILYANGQGVPRNLSQARAWMQKAAAAGDEDARDWLAAN